MEKNTFVCEICGCETPKEYESYEPNVCLECMPTDDYIVERDAAIMLGYGDDYCHFD